MTAPFKLFWMKRKVSSARSKLLRERFLPGEDARADLNSSDAPYL